MEPSVQMKITISNLEQLIIERIKGMCDMDSFLLICDFVLGIDDFSSRWQPDQNCIVISCTREEFENAVIDARERTLFESISGEVNKDEQDEKLPNGEGGGN